ncbi:MAG: N-acetylmuramoyl-L-alanine amidase [Hyphomonadaceae bacterium]
MIERLSPNFDTRGGRAIDLVVLHYTGMQDGETALRRLTDPAPVAGAYPGPWQEKALDPAAPLARVSAHYVMDEAGQAIRVVPEEARAWHAGVSCWEGEENVNARAIGVEIVNGGHDFGLPHYPEAQIVGLIQLLRDILRRRDLTPARVVGHSDIAPGRKADPGEHFPWKRLAEEGVALWPPAGALSGDDVDAMLSRFGYGLSAGRTACLAAFQRRFRPARIDGAADPETLALLAALT